MHMKYVVLLSFVMSENELLFPVSTPQAIFELPKLYHSAVVVASIFMYPRMTASI